MNFLRYFGTSWEQDIQIVIILFVWKIETNNKLWKYPKIKLLGHNKRMKVKKEILNNKRNYKLWRSLSIFVIDSRNFFKILGAWDPYNSKVNHRSIINNPNTSRQNIPLNFVRLWENLFLDRKIVRSYRWQGGNQTSETVPPLFGGITTTIR